MVRGTAIRIAFKSLKSKTEEAPRPLKVKGGGARKAKAPRAAATYRGARRNAAREALRSAAQKLSWRKVWAHARSHYK